MNNQFEREKLHFERLKHLRDRWWHEDHLVNQRLTWLLTSQTLLFAALAWLIPLRDDDDLWIWIIISGGISTAIIVLAGIMAAKCAQDNLFGKWPEIREGIKNQSRIVGSITSIGLPCIFILAWGLAICFLKKEETQAPRGVYEVPSHTNAKDFFLICKSGKIPKCFEEAKKTCTRKKEDLVWTQNGRPTIEPQLVRIGDRETMLSYRCREPHDLYPDKVETDEKKEAS